ncbi:MAG: hypothetical protein AAGE89_10995 [Pseudomonadota bacterium]
MLPRFNQQSARFCSISRWIRFAGLATFIYLTIVVCLSVSAAAQSPIRATTEVETRNGYGRLVITLPELTKFVDYTVSSEDNVLVIDLDDVLDVDLVSASAPLEGYIRIARQDPDGRGLRFALNQGVRVNTMAAGEHLFIDFLPPDWRGELPAIPERIVRKLENRAEEALEIAEQNAIEAKKTGVTATMKVRLGRHPTFSRFVFSWNVPFEASFKRDKNEVSINFNKVGETDLSALSSELPALVSSVKAKRLSKATVVALTVADDAKIRSYFDGDDYVVDVTSDELTKTGAGGARLPFVIGALPPVASGTREVAESNTFPRERELARLPAQPEILDDTPTAINEEASETFRDDPLQSSRPPLTEEEREQRTEEELAQKTAQEPASVNNVEAIDTSARKFPGLSTVRAAINSSEDAVRVVFPFDKTTPAAIFRRGKAIWTVFKTDSIIDIAALEALAGDFVRDVKLYEKDYYKAIRIVLPSVQLASSAIDENDWIVSIGSTVIRASTTLSVSRAVNDDGALYLQVPLEEARGHLILEDPVVGDDLHVVVADPPSRGLVRQQSFVNLRILPSTHALAFSSNGDGVRTTLYDNQVVIDSLDGMPLSPTKNLRASGAGTFTEDEWYDLPLEQKTLRAFSIVEFAADERNLLAEIANADEDERARSRMRLAQFYAANGFAPEALAKLSRAVEDDPVLENKAAYVQTKASAEVQMGRYEDALVTLGSERFARDPHAAFWRTIAANKIGKHELANRNAPIGEESLGSHDAATKQAFFLSASDAALHANDLNGVKNYLANVILDNPEPYHLGRYEILQGELALAEQREADARFFFTRAEESEDIRIAADAWLHRIIVDHETGAINAEEAIDELERFIAVWRKDHLELEAIDKLTRILAEERDYRRAFELVEVAIISDNENPLTFQIQDNMKAVFRDLFHKGVADDLPAIDSLSLYYDFRSLMPIGRVGDEIVRYLASRLIDLDLLAQASELLEHQVDQRLRGAARAKVAADLAVVHLLDDKPHRAITTLRKSQTANLPAALRRQRLMIEGFAIAQTGKTDVALELLEPLNGEDVERLRATINWDARRWQEAGRLLEKTHGGRWGDSEPLEPQARLDLMRAAIAYSLAKDDFALNRLNQKFGAKMAESSDAPIFQILVEPLDNESFERDVAVDNILNISSQDTFLQDYRRRYFGRTRAPSEV